MFFFRVKQIKSKVFILVATRSRFGLLHTHTCSSTDGERGGGGGDGVLADGDCPPWKGVTCEDFSFSMLQRLVLNSSSIFLDRYLLTVSFLFRFFLSFSFLFLPILSSLGLERRESYPARPFRRSYHRPYFSSSFLLRIALNFRSIFPKSRMCSLLIRM